MAGDCEHPVQGARFTDVGTEALLSPTELGFGPGTLPPSPVSCLLYALHIGELRTILEEILLIVLLLFSPKQMLIQGSGAGVLSGR